MTYYGSVGNSNLCVRGETSTGQNQVNADGFYNGMFMVCSGITDIKTLPATNNSHRCTFASNCVPVITSCQTSAASEISMGSNHYRNEDRMFHTNMAQSFSSVNTMAFTSPFSTSTTNQNLRAYKNTSLSNNQTFISTSVTAGYNYAFMGYRRNSSSGSFLTLTTAVNWFYNGTYGGNSFAYLQALFCDFEFEEFGPPR